MDYNEGIKHMKCLSKLNGEFSPYNGITIKYPGYKQLGDYRLLVDGGAPTHADISEDLYNMVIDNEYSYNELKDFLTDIYDNGTNTEYNDETLDYLQSLIYWITLQEEINYPRTKGYAGINLPFCRYFEAIYSSLSISNFDISEVKRRCNNHGGFKPNLYPLLNPPIFYHY